MATAANRTAARAGHPAEAATPTSERWRWSAVIAHRERLVRLARVKGAGDEAEDVVQEALLRAATFPELDHERAWPFLSAIVVRRVVDLHRQTARERNLLRHAALAPAVSSGFETELCDRDEARWVAREFLKHAPPALLSIIRRRLAGTPWQEIAADSRQSPSALETRVRRAMADFRRSLTRSERRISPNHPPVARV